MLDTASVCSHLTVCDVLCVCIHWPSHRIAVLFAWWKNLRVPLYRAASPPVSPTRRPRAPVQRNRIGSARRFFKFRAVSISRPPRTTTVRVNTAVFARAPLLFTPPLQVAARGLQFGTCTQSVKQNKSNSTPTRSNTQAPPSHTHTAALCVV